MTHPFIVKPALSKRLWALKLIYAFFCTGSTVKPQH